MAQTPYDFALRLVEKGIDRGLSATEQRLTHKAAQTQQDQQRAFQHGQGIQQGLQELLGQLAQARAGVTDPAVQQQIDEAISNIEPMLALSPEKVLPAYKQALGQADSPISVIGQAMGVAAVEERRREEEAAMRERVRDWFEELRPSLADGSAPPKERQLLVDEMEAVEQIMPGTFSPGDISLARGVAAIRDERAELQAELETQRSVQELNKIVQEVGLLNLNQQEARLKIADRYEDSTRGRRQMFLDTGTNYTELTDDDKRALADLLMMDPKDLRRYGQQTFARLQRLQRIEQRKAEMDLKLMEADYRMGEHEFTAAEEELAHTRWSRERERALAPMEDASDFADMIGQAIRQGDYHLLEHYRRMLDQPESALGQQLRGFGLTHKQLDGFIKDAREVYDINLEKLRYDRDERRTQARAALRKLERNEYLWPYERAALRAKFELEAQEAGSELLDLLHFGEFDGQIERMGALFDLADSVPAEFWANLPDSFKATMRGIGVDVKQLETISAVADFRRGEPERQEAWEQFQLFLEAPPDDFAAAMPGVIAALERAGITDPILLNSMEQMVKSVWIWEHDDRMRLWALANAQVQQALMAGQTPADVARLVTAANTVASQYRQSIRVSAEHLTMHGCATLLNVEGWPWASFNVEGRSVLDNTPCPQMIEGHMGHKERYDQMLDATFQAYNRLVETTDMSMEQSMAGFPRETIDLPEPRGNVLGLSETGVAITEHHMQLANTFAHQWLAGEEEQAEATARALAAQIGEPGARELTAHRVQELQAHIEREGEPGPEGIIEE